VQKLKDARAEATKEIEEYKKTKEQEFKAFESSVRS
jgi:V-type H+-transporting ATPase subunit G